MNVKIINSDFLHNGKLLKENSFAVIPDDIVRKFPNNFEYSPVKYPEPQASPKISPAPAKPKSKTNRKPKRSSKNN